MLCTEALPETGIGMQTTNCDQHVSQPPTERWLVNFNAEVLCTNPEVYSFMQMLTFRCTHKHSRAVLVGT